MSDNPRHNWASFTNGKFIITAYQAPYDFIWSDGETKMAIKAGDYIVEDISVVGGKTCIDKTTFEKEFSLVNEFNKIRFPRRID